MTGPTPTLPCPKCSGQMRSYERSGVTLDQCTDCRGIFLDRGELERLIDAEDIHYGPAGGGPRERVRTDADRRAGYADERYGDSDQGRPAGGERKRRGGFLGDLLDFGD